MPKRNRHALALALLAVAPWSQGCDPSSSEAGSNLPASATASAGTAQPSATATATAAPAPSDPFYAAFAGAPPAEATLPKPVGKLGLSYSIPAAWIHQQCWPGEVDCMLLKPPGDPDITKTSVMIYPPNEKFLSDAFGGKGWPAEGTPAFGGQYGFTPFVAMQVGRSAIAGMATRTESKDMVTVRIFTKPKTAKKIMLVELRWKPADPESRKVVTFVAQSVGEDAGQEPAKAP